MPGGLPGGWMLKLRYDTSLRGRRLGSFRRERNARAGSREKGGEEMLARRPLFWPSRLLIMYAKITQLWMTSCQISMAAIHLFLAFVFQKQEIWGEGTYYIKKSSNAVVRWKKKVATMRGLLSKIQHKSVTSFAEGNVLDVATCMQCWGLAMLAMGEIFIPHKLGFSEISPPQSLLPSNVQILNLMLINLFIIVFILLVIHCVWQKIINK